MIVPVRSSSLVNQEDPFSAALLPPAGETEPERRARLRLEQDAKRVSEQIDEELRIERERLKKTKNDVKLLLLGQAESGKSTLQKQFQLMYKPSSLDDERLSWRTVVFFNIVHTIKHILDTLEDWEDTFDDHTGDARSIASDSGKITTDHSPTTAAAIPDQKAQSPTQESLKYQIANLRRRLCPLVAADAELADRLTGGVTVSGSGKGGIFVRSGWQARSIENSLNGKQLPKGSAQNTKLNDGDVGRRSSSLVEDVGKMLDASKKDIQELWEHPTVKALIAKRKLRLEEWAEFFLNNINRIASCDYSPTTDDILHARIRTMGVAEHVFDVTLNGKDVTWHLYDVGGARGQRNSWVPYFDDANAIIFVAPISAFDQYLEEDPRTNRIDDSLQLFTQICSNPLLKRAHLVLFLNKTDILQAKLAAGIRVSKYITSYGNRVNEFETVVQYFRAHFQHAFTRKNDNRRTLYTHLTSVVNTKTTQRIIGNVRESIFRDYLQSAALV